VQISANDRLYRHSKISIIKLPQQVGEGTPPGHSYTTQRYARPQRSKHTLPGRLISSRSIQFQKDSLARALTHRTRTPPTWSIDSAAQVSSVSARAGVTIIPFTTPPSGSRQLRRRRSYDEKLMKDHVSCRSASAILLLGWWGDAFPVVNSHVLILFVKLRASH
jgi:hypothetical protein